MGSNEKWEADSHGPSELSKVIAERDALIKERDALRGNSLVCWLRDHSQITTIGELFVYFKVLASIPIETPLSLTVKFSVPLLKRAGDEIDAIKDDKK